MIKSYMKIFFTALTLSSLIFVSNIFSSEEDWVVNDIRLSGLQRVSAGSVFNVMPIAVGDTVNLYSIRKRSQYINNKFSRKTFDSFYRA